MNKEKYDNVIAAIRKAVNERKEKTWYDFYDVSYEDMDDFLNSDNVIMSKKEYDYLCECRKLAESLRSLFFSWIGASHEVRNAMARDVATQPLGDIFQTARQVYNEQDKK